MRARQRCTASRGSSRVPRQPAIPHMALDHERAAQPERIRSGAVRSLDCSWRADNTRSLQLGDDFGRIAVLKPLWIREVPDLPPRRVPKLADRFGDFAPQLVRGQEGENPVGLPVRPDLE